MNIVQLLPHHVFSPKRHGERISLPYLVVPVFCAHKVFLQYFRMVVSQIFNDHLAGKPKEVALHIFTEVWIYNTSEEVQVIIHYGERI